MLEEFPPVSQVQEEFDNEGGKPKRVFQNMTIHK